MVHNKINHCDYTNDAAGQKCRQCCRSPDNVGIEPRHQREDRDPKLAMLQTEILAKRPRQIGLQSRRVSEAISQVDEPRGEEERDAVADLERDLKSSREEQEPRYGDQRRVETNQV